MFLRIITFLILIISPVSSFSKTNVSHAIAMHGKPKYNEDFINVEYIDINGKIRTLKCL